jgi:exosome complex RNA-binding protein Rrp4
VIWIDGELEGIRKAAAAISLIDKGTHLHGLTDEVRQFLTGRSEIPASQNDDMPEPKKLAFEFGVNRE